MIKYWNFACSFFKLALCTSQDYSVCLACSYLAGSRPAGLVIYLILKHQGFVGWTLQETCQEMLSLLRGNVRFSSSMYHQRQPGKGCLQHQGQYWAFSVIFPKGQKKGGVSQPTSFCLMLLAKSKKSLGYYIHSKPFYYIRNKARMPKYQNLEGIKSWALLLPYKTFFAFANAQCRILYF